MCKVNYFYKSKPWGSSQTLFENRGKSPLAKVLIHTRFQMTICLRKNGLHKGNRGCQPQSPFLLFSKHINTIYHFYEVLLIAKQSNLSNPILFKPDELFGL